MNIPKDPYILLSYINTQLRDHYSSLDDLCRSLLIEQDDLKTTLSSIGYIYIEALNSFSDSF